MKVLVLDQNPKERSLIQNVLKTGGHEIVPAENAEQALRLIEKGESRFVIADNDTEDVRKSDLVRRVRASRLPPVYFLILTAEEEDSAEADDTLRKPLSASELKARILVGQRFLSLGDHLSQARDQIENMAVYDGLTGMLNRGAFYRSAQGELERARRLALPMSLIALDIENFKALNEEYGMETGDEVLKVVSQIIREKSRPYDCVGRWTGEEFVIALAGVIGSDAEKMAERIIKGVRSANVTYNDKVLNVHISAGIASASRIGASSEVEPLIEQARAAMSRAKEDGGDRVNLNYV